MRLLVMMLLMLIGYVAVAAEPVTVTLERGADAAEVQLVAGVTVVAITSRRGIGHAVLQRTGQAWPERLTIRLGIKDLEGFTMANGAIVVRSFLKRRNPVPYWTVDNPDQRQDTADGTLTLPIRQTAAGIEIDVPAEMLAGHPEQIRIHWVDFYRM